MPAVPKCEQLSAWVPWTTLTPAPGKALMSPKHFPSILTHILAYIPESSCAFTPIHLPLCHQSEGLFCLCSLSPEACTLLLPQMFSWALLPRRSAPPHPPSFPALKWCQLELISPKHK